MVWGHVWASATALTGRVGGRVNLCLARVLPGFGEDATFPTAWTTQNGTAPGQRGFAQGITHAFARLGDAVAPPVVAFPICRFGWRSSFVEQSSGLDQQNSALFASDVLFTRELTPAALLLPSGFFAELVIGPIWSVPMDIAPHYAGTARGLMNTGSAVAALVSPIVFGLIVDLSGGRTLPFVGSVGLCPLGAGLAVTLHPERPFAEAGAAARPAGAPVPAGGQETR